MAYDFREVVTGEVKDFLNKNKIKEVEPEDMVKRILGGTLYHEKKLDNKKMILFRFYTPVTMREEVFIGSVLLNTFLSKNILLSCKENQLGNIRLVANDVENYYYLWFTEGNSLKDLKDGFIKTLENNLEALYFASNNEELGVYGDFDKLFDFHKNNIEGFPIFPIPEAYMERLGGVARDNLLKGIDENSFSSNPTTITANMAFFLSKDGTEFQSPYKLLTRAVTEYKDYTGLDVKDLKDALNLEKDYDLSDKKGCKKLTDDVKKVMGKVTFSPDKLKEFLKKVVKNYDILAKKDPKNWNLKYARKKALVLTPKETINEILSQTQLGHLFLSDMSKDKTNTYCRCCGVNSPMLKENHITMGEDVGKFYNQMVNTDVKKDVKICVKCTIQSFLMTKLVGNISGSLAFVPQQGSMVFHYGHHDEQEMEEISKKIESVWEHIKERKEILRELAKCRREMQKIRKKQKKSKEEKNKLEELSQKHQENNATLDEIDFLMRKNANLDVDKDPAMDFFSNAQFDSNELENYVIGIGLGNYRLMFFMIPQFKNYVDKKPHDYIQKRFNTSRITMLVMLSFLRKICGCDGPFYYMTLPSLNKENFSHDTFYVKDEAYSAEDVLRYYEFFASFSKEVVKPEEPSKQIIKKILLSERMVEDPLLTLSEVMRHSKVLTSRGGDKYRVMKGKENLLDYFNVYMKSREYQNIKWREE